MNPEILKEHKDYLIINKPSGLVVHADGHTKERTLCDWILEEYPDINGVGESTTLSNGSVIDRPGIVHRLDRDTSGVMIVARTEKGFSYLKKLFKNREIEKTYHALVYGNIKEEELVIDDPIGRSKKDFRQWFSGAVRAMRGEPRDAVTKVKVLQRTSDKKVTLIEAQPKTGRTHQIRVHLKSIYHPLVCDSLYAPDRECMFGLERTALHAKSLKFIDPEGESVYIEGEYQGDFAKTIESLT